MGYLGSGVGCWVDRGMLRLVFLGMGLMWWKRCVAKMAWDGIGKLDWHGLWESCIGGVWGLGRHFN